MSIFHQIVQWCVGTEYSPPPVEKTFEMFVGGPWDGQRRLVPCVCEELESPLGTYSREWLGFEGQGAMLSVFLFEGVEYEDALELILFRAPQKGSDTVS